MKKKKKRKKKQRLPTCGLGLLNSNKMSTHKSPATVDLMNNNGTGEHLKFHYLLVCVFLPLFRSFLLLEPRCCGVSCFPARELGGDFSPPRRVSSETNTDPSGGRDCLKVSDLMKKQNRKKNLPKPFKYLNALCGESGENPCCTRNLSDGVDDSSAGRTRSSGACECVCACAHWRICARWNACFLKSSISPRR